MLSEYLPIAILIILATGLAGLVVILGHLFGPKRQSDAKAMPYESGMNPYGPGTRRMSVKLTTFDGSGSGVGSTKKRRESFRRSKPSRRVPKTRRGSRTSRWGQNRRKAPFRRCPSAPRVPFLAIPVPISGHLHSSFRCSR